MKRKLVLWLIQLAYTVDKEQVDKFVEYRHQQLKFEQGMNRLNAALGRRMSEIFNEIGNAFAGFNEQLLHLPETEK